jgi:hypothetical protein
VYYLSVWGQALHVQHLVTHQTAVPKVPACLKKIHSANSAFLYVICVVMIHTLGGTTGGLILASVGNDTLFALFSGNASL